MPNAKSIIAANLRAERARKDWSRLQLSAKTGIAETMIAKYEHGAARIPLENAWKLADVFGVSLDALCGRDKQL